MLASKAVAAADAPQKGSAKFDLTDKFGALFPTWPTVLATIIAVLILLLVLTKLVYQPVKKMNHDRRDYIQNNINEAESQNSSAVSDREKAQEELTIARIQAAEIISASKVDAEEIKAHRIAKAKKSAQIIIDSAKKDIVAQQMKFDQESEEAIIEVALSAAAKVVEKDVDSVSNRKIITDFIKAAK